MTEPSAPLPVSEDTLLGGRVKLRQPLSGYRVAIDPVLLAAAVPAAAGDTVLDIGCGVGAAALCLAARVEGCRITGIEAQRDLVRLAGENISLNDLLGRVTVMAGDLLRPPPRLEPGSFAHVMANPPFLEAGAASVSPDAGKVAATVEGEADLAAWVRFALAMVRSKGYLTFIHRADRMDQLLAQLVGRAGEIVVFPLWAGHDKPAKRILLRARKGVETPTRLTPGLVLHEADGRYTPAANAVLRQGAALTFS
ncbi:MAG TPA: methyltransferase [Stellaceae bacterium]|nr:methyltransferase [Stellaceae bacterium]